MGRVAVAAAESVGYVNAGTIEFLFDSKEQKYYFLEMNTRLQVEHPITEMVSGVDIVKEQISIAAGRKLRYQQQDLSPKGWSIECRITAEDPFNNFLPSAGQVTYLKEPTGPGVRVESALYRGCEISLYYDPMVAKLVVHGESRAEAILRMKRALAEYRIGGIKTSIPFHQHIMDSTEFIWGTFDTGFLNRRSLRKQEQAHEESERVAAVAAAMMAHKEKREAAVMVGPEAVNGNGSSVSLWKSVGRLRATRGRL
jgi:acetyl/propionyl-CoA carboxylase alpha subunit